MTKTSNMGLFLVSALHSQNCRKLKQLHILIYRELHMPHINVAPYLMEEISSFPFPFEFWGFFVHAMEWQQDITYLSSYLYCAHHCGREGLGQGQAIMEGR